jgi:uncharacterized protein YaaN involved in tellurite resistance
MIQEERLTPFDADSAASDLAWLPDELNTREREEAKLLAQTLRADESNSVLNFGRGIQQEIADFASSVLNGVRSRDAGDLGDTITELVTTIQNAATDGNENRKRLLDSIPAVNRLLRRVRRSVVQSQTIEVQVEMIRSKLDEAYLVLQKDIEMLDMVLKHNYSYFKKLDVHIAAAQLRWKEAMEGELPALRHKAEKGSDPWAAQNLSELNAFIQRLEIRLDDFRRTRYLSLSQAPRIRLLQQGEQIIMEKIQSVMYNLIPLWKMDLVTGLAQHRAARALDVQNLVRDRIETSIRESAERTRSVSVGIARESAQGMIGMATLRSVHDELIATLEETIQIYAEGRKRRSETEQELAAMERELKLKVAEIAGNSMQ